MLEVKDLEVSFWGQEKSRVVKGVSFDVHDGEIYGLVGESGIWEIYSIEGVNAEPTDPRRDNRWGYHLSTHVNSEPIAPRASGTPRSRDIAYLPECDECIESCD